MQMLTIGGIQPLNDVIAQLWSASERHQWSVVCKTGALCCVGITRKLPKTHVTDAHCDRYHSALVNSIEDCGVKGSGKETHAQREKLHNGSQEQAISPGSSCCTAVHCVSELGIGTGNEVASTRRCPARVAPLLFRAAGCNCFKFCLGATISASIRAADL